MAAGMGVGWAVAAELEVRAWSRLTAQERLPARARAAAAMASVASAAAMAYSSRCLACGLSSSAACHRRRFQPAGSGRRVAVAISTMRSQTRRPMRGAALDTRASPEAQSSSCSNRRSCRRRRRPASSSRDPRAWCRASTCGHETRGRAWRSMRGGVALAALVASAWAVRIDLEPDVRCCVLRLVAVVVEPVASLPNGFRPQRVLAFLQRMKPPGVTGVGRKRPRTNGWQTERGGTW